MNWILELISLVSKVNDSANHEFMNICSVHFYDLLHTLKNQN